MTKLGQLPEDNPAERAARTEKYAAFFKELQAEILHDGRVELVRRYLENPAPWPHGLDWPGYQKVPHERWFTGHEDYWHPLAEAKQAKMDAKTAELLKRVPGPEGRPTGKPTNLVSLSTGGTDRHAAQLAQPVTVTAPLPFLAPEGVTIPVTSVTSSVTSVTTPVTTVTTPSEAVTSPVTTPKTPPKRDRAAYMRERRAREKTTAVSSGVGP